MKDIPKRRNIRKAGRNRKKIDFFSSSFPTFQLGKE